MKLELTSRTKILAVVVVMAGATAAAWFLYFQDWLNPPPKPEPIVKAKPKPAAPQPAKPAVAQAPKPAPAAPAAAPAAVAQVPAKEPAKPVVIPAAAPVVLAQAPAKPLAAAAPVKEEKPKPAAKTPRAEQAAKAEAPKSAEAPKPAASMEESAKPAPAAPKAEPKLAPQLVAGPVTPGPKFNDLVTAVLYRDAKGVDELIAFGKWPDRADSRGMTPLMIAVMLGEAPIAETLLKAGADPNHTAPGGTTAMSLARERQDAGMTGLLQRHGGR